MSVRLAQLSLAALAIFGGYTLHVFMRQNGFWKLIEVAADKKLLDDGVTPMPLAFTGVEAIDGLLRVFLAFFWPTVDGNNPALSLKCFLFVFQSAAILTINLIEGMRSGNYLRVISFTTIYSILFQGIGIAVVGPAYLLVHIFTSPTARNPTPANISLNEGFLTGIPFGIIIGFILPTIWMSLPHPSAISFDQKVLGVLFWQGSPIYAGLYASLWASALWPNIKYATEAQAWKNQILLLRYVYKFGLAIATTAHIATLTLSLGAYLIPALFSPGVVNAIQPYQVYVPPNPFNSDTRVDSIAQGAMFFIQWDYYISSAAYLIWALTLRYSGLRESVDLEAVISIVARIVTLGPMGAALTYVWDRDEAVFSGGGDVTVPDSIKKIL